MTEPSVSPFRRNRVPLEPVKDSGTGTVRDPDMVALDEVIAQINDLFSGDYPDSSVRTCKVGVPGAGAPMADSRPSANNPPDASP